MTPGAQAELNRLEDDDRIPRDRERALEAALSRAQSQIVTLTAQRDDLRAALKAIVEHGPADESCIDSLIAIIEIAEAAIASAGQP